MLTRRIIFTCLCVLPFCFNLTEFDKLLQKAKVEYMIEKNTPGAFISYDAFQEFVSETFITQTDENEFSDLRAKNLSFMRISLKVDTFFEKILEILLFQLGSDKQHYRGPQHHRHQHIHRRAVDGSYGWSNNQWKYL